MRLLVQRATNARIEVDGSTVGEIGRGLVVLVGFGREDEAKVQAGEAQLLLDKAAERLLKLRIFPDEADRLAHNLIDFGGEILAAPQFTLHADLKKGTRPSFHRAAAPAIAQTLFDAFLARLELFTPGKVQSGVFGAEMFVHLVNWGPLTIWLDEDSGL